MGDCTELLDIHLDASITGNIENRKVRSCKVRPHCSRETIPHRAKPAAGYPGPWMFEAIVLGCPHLVLPDFRDNDRITSQELAHLPNHKLRVKPAILRTFERVVLFPVFDLLEPGIL